MFSDIPEIIQRLTLKVEALEARLKTLTTSNEVEQPIDLKEAAKFIKKKPQTIYGLVSARKIPHNKTGKNLLFYRSELSEWIKTGGRKVYG